jgi:hypothetical protein
MKYTVPGNSLRPLLKFDEELSLSARGGAFSTATMKVFEQRATGPALAITDHRFSRRDLTSIIIERSEVIQKILQHLSLSEDVSRVTSACVRQKGCRTENQVDTIAQ